MGQKYMNHLLIEAKLSRPVFPNPPVRLSRGLGELPLLVPCLSFHPTQCPNYTTILHILPSSWALLFSPHGEKQSLCKRETLHNAISCGSRRLRHHGNILLWGWSMHTHSPSLGFGKVKGSSSIQQTKSEQHCTNNRPGCWLRHYKRGKGTEQTSDGCTLWFWNI